MINAPVDVQLSRHDVVQPDLIVIRAERLSIISPAKVLGPPDLVVEIFSESTRTRDRTLKLNLYEKSGVPEYWLVDPKEHLVRKYRLSGERYEPAGTYADRVVFGGLDRVEVDLTRVW